ncbi:acyl--CoA ligase [Natronomonas salina]|uniref:class I adenylate-forming enzyme family protein n=1 Tax=Natronomonas salina TaxID=1710540 RepID=UPI0015B577B2|nr:class I adenylate-forming enzyme family protein [Natronomonas salina]QLD90046.1 acyl--CoA ligase [Natronomonas salina]
MLRWPDATLYGGVAEVAEARPTATALVADGRAWSYEALLAESRALAGGLDRIGVGPGDAVTIWLGNRPEWITAQLAASYLGAAAVAANTRYGTHELEHLLTDSGSRVLLVESTFLDREYLESVAELAPSVRESSPDEFDPGGLPDLEEVIALESREEFPAVRAYDDVVEAGADVSRRPATDPEAPACIFYTSGTTGDPKGCPQTNRSLLNHAHAVGEFFDLSTGDVVLGALPFPGVWGHNVWVSALVHGVPLVVQRHFDPGETVRLVEEHGVTYFSGLATMYERLVDHETFASERVESLRCGAVGFLGRGFDEATFDRIEDAVGFPLVQPYGLSEANSQVFVGDPEDPREQRYRVGGPLVHPEEEDATVVDPETGEELPPGERGELRLRGYNVVDGYLRRPDATAEDFEGEWLKTGDLASRDGEGRFFFEARLDDALRVRGFLVSPREIETVLDELAGVERSQVVGAPHPRHGHVPVAFVKRDGDVDAATLRSAMADRVADYKVPEAVEFVDAFPRSAGPHGEKIQKARLRERVADRYK